MGFQKLIFGIPVAKYLVMMRWLAVVYIVVVLVISAKARAASSEVVYIDHQVQALLP